MFCVKCARYHNKFARVNALERIVNKLRPIKADVTVNEVKAKIKKNSSELLKTGDKPSGSGMDDIPKISIDNFQKMLFLSDHVHARKGGCNIPVSQVQVKDTERCVSPVVEYVDNAGNSMTQVYSDAGDTEVRLTG
ncbi:hypothetical protein CBL_20628 [Carabus blaptoides fortunei]